MNFWEKSFNRNPILTIFLSLVAICGMGYLLYFIFVPATVASRVVDPDNIVWSQEEFEEIYASCNQVCANIKALQKSNVSTTDKETGFSSADRALGYENKLNELIASYNAKSRKITAKHWKSGDLPQKLRRSDFSCGDDDEPPTE